MPSTAKPQSPLRRWVRNVQLGYALGIGAFLIGIPLTSRAAMAMAESLDAMGGGLLAFVLGGLVSQLPALLVAPGVAYAAGLYFEGPRWALAISLVFGVQSFPLAIAAITVGLEEAASPARVALVLACSVVGTVLCALGFKRAQLRMQQRAAAKQQEIDAAGRLARIDFDALKGASAPAPEAGAAESARPEPANAEAAKPAGEAAPEAAPPEAKASGQG